MAGVYRLEKQWVRNGGPDSAYERTQIKIYTDHQFIYAGMTPDSAVGFGVGNYKQDTAYHITEKEFYSSYRLDTTRVFHLVVTTSDNGYTQNIPGIATLKGVKYDLMEQYSKISPAGKAPKLDGLWKMEKSIAVNGRDTVKKVVTQYKIFKDGYFLYAGRYQTGTPGKFKSTFGYGTCSLQGNKLVEQNTISSDAAALTHPFNIKIAFSGDDSYTQVIDNPQSKRESIETYVRIK